MNEKDATTEPQPEQIQEQSKKSIERVRGLVDDLKSVAEYERGIQPTSD